MRNYALLSALVGLGGCDNQVQKAAPASGAPIATSARPPSDAVEAPCTAASAWWKGAIAASDSGKITAIDTILVPPLGDRPASACVVRAWLPHGMRKGQPSWGGSDDSLPPALGRAGGDWRRLIEYDADGPDGNLSGYQRGKVRCTVAQSWDGGDDGDSTYVAEPWYRHELTCWAEPTAANPATP